MRRSFGIDVMADICRTYLDFVVRLADTDISAGYKLEDGTPCFGFIPSDTSVALIRELRKIKKRLYKKTKRIPKFLDIGCGIGNISLLAYTVGYKATGLEYNPKICKIAKNLCKYTNIDIIEGDMREFDKYHEYDVLYYYQPMKLYKDMTKFTIGLIKQIKPGAYIVCKGVPIGFVESKGFYRLKNTNIWRKKPKVPTITKHR